MLEQGVGVDGVHLVRLRGLHLRRHGRSFRAICKQAVGLEINNNREPGYTSYAVALAKAKTDKSTPSPTVSYYSQRAQKELRRSAIQRAAMTTPARHEASVRGSPKPLR